MFDRATTRFPNAVTNAQEGATFGDMPIPDVTKYHVYNEDFDYYQATNFIVTTVGTGAVALVPGDGGLLSLINSGAAGDSLSVQELTPGFVLTSGLRTWGRFNFAIDSLLARFVVGLVNVTTTPFTAGSITDGIWLQNTGRTAITPAAQVTLTSAGNLSAINFTITGQNALGVVISEVLVGPNVATVTSVLTYARITNIAASAAVGTAVSVGTGAVTNAVALLQTLGAAGNLILNGPLTSAEFNINVGAGGVVTSLIDLPTPTLSVGKLINFLFYYDGGVYGPVINGTNTATGPGRVVWELSGPGVTTPVRGETIVPATFPTAATLSTLFAVMNDTAEARTMTVDTVFVMKERENISISNPNAFAASPALAGIGAGGIFLGSAVTFGGFGGSAGMTNTGVTTQVNNGNIGTTAASTLITGFHDPGFVFTETGANIGAVSGTVFTGTNNTPVVTQARSDILAAYNALSALVAGPDPSASGNLAGLTLGPGVYTSASGAFKVQGGNLTLDAGGNANAIFVFQMASTLLIGGPGVAAPQSILLAGGAQAKNVFWRVGSAATINAAGGGVFEGTVISMAGAAVSTAGNTTPAIIHGRLLSLVASVTMVDTVITVPAP